MSNRCFGFSKILKKQTCSLDHQQSFVARGQKNYVFSQLSVYCVQLRWMHNGAQQIIKWHFFFWIECNFTIVLTPLWDNDDFLFPCVHSFYLRKIETIDTISSNFYTPKNAVTKFPCTKYSPHSPNQKSNQMKSSIKKTRVQPFIHFFLTHKERWFIISKHWKILSNFCLKWKEAK